MVLAERGVAEPALCHALASLDVEEVFRVHPASPSRGGLAARPSRTLLRVQAAALGEQLVERAEIGLRARHQGVGVGGPRGDRAAALLASSSSRTDTSACASVPSVTACTW